MNAASEPQPTQFSAYRKICVRRERAMARPVRHGVRGKAECFRHSVFTAERVDNFRDAG